MAGGAAIESGGSSGSRRGGLPQTAAMMNLLTDMAFNLLIFFVVLADPSSETGRPQQMPSATNEQQPSEQQAQNIKIDLGDPDRSNPLRLNGEPMTLAELPGKLAILLAGKTKPDEKIVAVASAKDTPYGWWIQVTARIEQAGGVVALQLEEEKEVTVK
jgi:biopolymer transport protein ExbD